MHLITPINIYKILATIFYCFYLFVVCFSGHNIYSIKSDELITYTKKVLNEKKLNSIEEMSLLNSDLGAIIYTIDDKQDDYLIFYTKSFFSNKFAFTSLEKKDNYSSFLFQNELKNELVLYKIECDKLSLVSNVVSYNERKITFLLCITCAYIYVLLKKEQA